MKQIKLSQGLSALVDDADYNWLNQWKWSAAKIGLSYYAVRKDNKTMIMMHRLILGITDRKILSDHKDHNGLNNQRNNLRAATSTQNNCNKRPHIGSTSKYLGVHFCSSRKKWTASIRDSIKKKHILIGRFDDETIAALAYNKKAIELRGEFANLNNVSV